MFYAQIDANGICISEVETTGTITADNVFEVEGTGYAGRKKWNGTAWEDYTPPEPVSNWWIDVGPFFDRFGAQKWEILSSADLMVQAIVKDCQVRKYIDLQGRAADIGMALDLLLSKGFTIDKNAIITTKPTELERHKT